MKKENIDLIMNLIVEIEYTNCYVEHLMDYRKLQFSEADNKTINDLLQETVSLSEKMNDNLGAVCEIFFQKTNQET